MGWFGPAHLRRPPGLRQDGFPWLRAKRGRPRRLLNSLATPGGFNALGPPGIAGYGPVDRGPPQQRHQQLTACLISSGHTERAAVKTACFSCVVAYAGMGFAGMYFVSVSVLGFAVAFVVCACLFVDCLNHAAMVNTTPAVYLSLHTIIYSFIPKRLECNELLAADVDRLY